MAFATEYEALKEVNFCNSARHELTHKEINSGRVPCSKCKNRGYIYFYSLGRFGYYVKTRDCECVTARGI